MKRIILTLLALLATVCFADPTTKLPSVTLAWDQSPDPSVAGYSVYWGTSSRQYTNSISVSGIANTSCTVSNLARGTHYYFAATCVATNGLTSDYSLEVEYTTLNLPPVPFNLRVIVDQP